MALGTVAALVTAAAAVGGATYSAVQGADAKRGRKRALGQQETAQRQAQSAAASQQRKNDELANAANQRTPDITSILNDELTRGKRGVGSTLLSGAGATDPLQLRLGRSTLLGG